MKAPLRILSGEMSGTIAAVFLHLITKLIIFGSLAVLVLALLTLLTRNKRVQTRSPSLGELPEDKATHLNRI